MHLFARLITIVFVSFFFCFVTTLSSCDAFFVPPTSRNLAFTHATQIDVSGTLDNPLDLPFTISGSEHDISAQFGTVSYRGFVFRYKMDLFNHAVEQYIFLLTNGNVTTGKIAESLTVMLRSESGGDCKALEMTVDSSLDRGIHRAERLIGVATFRLALSDHLVELPSVPRYDVQANDDTGTLVVGGPFAQMKNGTGYIILDGVEFAWRVVAAVDCRTAGYCSESDRSHFSLHSIAYDANYVREEWNVLCTFRMLLYPDLPGTLVVDFGVCFPTLQPIVYSVAGTWSGTLPHKDIPLLVVQ